MKETPIRQQYLSIKQKYPGVIVLFRLGDFYETFDEDARITSRELEIVLTGREVSKGNKIPMAGIPYHALDNYLAKLINRGYKVAICEQLTKPGATKGIVDREVVRLVTPGTVIEPDLLNSKLNNYLVSLVTESDKAGIAYIDISTGEFAATQLPKERLLAELGRLHPPEIIISETEEISGLKLPESTNRLEKYWFELDKARQTLLDHFKIVTLDGFGCSGLPLAVRAAGAALHYVQETQKRSLNQITGLSTYSVSSFMALDEQTKRNLELFQNARGTETGSLLSIIDVTRTAMGGRLLRRWLGQPLLDLAELENRQEAIGWFTEETLQRNRTIKILGEIGDLERLINRVRSGVAIPRELVNLANSLKMVPALKELFSGCPFPVKDLRPCLEIVELVSRSIEEQPSGLPGEGGVIKNGFSADLDSLRLTTKNGRQYLADLERREREKTGIKTLKISYNRVFGYYIEVTQANLDQVPNDYIRKQTLVGGERFITPELKDYETMILTAQERMSELEIAIFQQICRQVASFGEVVSVTANAIAFVDVISCLGEIAVRYNYIRPVLNQNEEIIIRGGRHPVVEQALPSGNFVPNDTELSTSGNQLIILTGPNMSGKSTYLRQVALIVLMAQLGSFVPAVSATIGLADRIFTRIGAGEDIAAGQSTFMVEMVETANILHNATRKSLIILDEIGRGTSTYDGLSIARAVAEYIHNHPRLGARTLFATHYHELIELAGVLPRVKNYNVAVSEENGRVVFLYRIIPGGADQSYGIHVAQLAGLPSPVIHRAREVLAGLEKDGQKIKINTGKEKMDQSSLQLPLLGKKSPILEELEKLDIYSLTPLEALTKLFEFQKKSLNS